MPPTPFSKFVNPRLPPAALGIESNNATVVYLERGRNGFVLKRAASATLPEGLVHPSFDEPNVSDTQALASVLSEVALSAGLGKQRKWSVALPEASTRTAILTLEAAPASRAEMAEVLRWKTERSFGATEEELRVTREKIPPDAQGRARYLAIGARASIMAEYESVFAALDWKAGLVLPRHQGEARLLSRASGNGDALLISSHTEGFTALLLRGRQPVIVRSVICETEDRDDELYRLMLFYRDRVVAADDPAREARPLDRLLVVGEGFDKNHVSEIVSETLEISLRALGPVEVGLTLPSSDFNFDSIAAPAGLATLAW